MPLQQAWDSSGIKLRCWAHFHCLPFMALHARQMWEDPAEPRDRERRNGRWISARRDFCMGDIERHFVFLTWSLATFYIPLVLSRQTTPECRILIHRDITTDLKLWGLSVLMWKDLAWSSGLQRGNPQWHGLKLLLSPPLAWQFLLTSEGAKPSPSPSVQWRKDCVSCHGFPSTDME